MADIGVDMTPFGIAARLAPWAGMCPGQHQSAGKARGGKAHRGSKWLRGHLTQAVRTASKTKRTWRGKPLRGRSVGRLRSRLCRKPRRLAVGRANTCRWP